MARLVLANGTHSVTSSEYKRLFGPGLNSLVAVKHLPIGGATNQTVGLKIVCDGGVPFSVTLQFFLSSEKGVNSGNGGEIRVSLRENGTTGYPMMQSDPIASASWKPMLYGTVPTGETRLYKTFYFSNVKKAFDFNKTYWIVVENVSDAAAENYLSLGVNVSHKDIPENRFIYRFENNLYTIRSGSTWRNATISGVGNLKYHPQYQLVYSDGRAQGALLNKTNSTVTPVNRMFRASADRGIREKVTLPYEKTFSGLSFSTACNSQGELKWHIKRDPDEILLSGSVSEDTVNFKTLSENIGFQKWYDVEFPSNVTFEKDVTYYIEFEASSGEWLFSATSHAISNGGLFPAVFSASIAQTNTTGFWNGYNVSNNYTGYDANTQYVLHEADDTASTVQPVPIRTVANLPANSTVAIVCDFGIGVSFRFVTVNNGRIVLTSGAKPERNQGTFDAIYVPLAGEPVVGTDISRAKLGKLTLRTGAWPVNTVDGAITILHNNQASYTGLVETLGISVGQKPDVRPGSLTEVSFSLKPAFVVTKPVSRDLHVEGAFVWVRNGETLTADEAASLPNPVPSNLSLANVPIYGTYTNKVPRWDARHFKIAMGSTEDEPLIDPKLKGYQVARFRISLETNNRIYTSVNKMVDQNGMTQDAQYSEVNAITITGSLPDGAGEVTPMPPSHASAAVLRRAVNGISRGNEVNYIGWGQNNQGAPGAQGQGGALSIGGAARFAELEGRGEFSTCRGGTIYDGCYRCTSNNSGPVYSRARLKSWDVLSPWFLLVKGHGNEVARPLVNARNFSVYILQKGQNVWRRVYHHATNPMGWQGVYGPDMSTDYPHLQHELTSQLRQEGNYQVLGLPYNANYNNHGGMGNLAYPSQFAPETVEGYLMLAEMRLDPSTPNAVVGAQFGMDPKFNDNSLKPDAANWFPAIYLSKLQRLTPEWQQYGIVNASHQLDGQLVLDAQRGGIGLSADRLFNTTIEGFN